MVIIASNLFVYKMQKQSFDVAIIGGGPGGYVAAIRASQLGLKVCVIEKEHLGGICLNWGCIPTKALLRSAEVLQTAQNASNFGIKISGKIEFDFAAIIKRSRDISAKLAGGITMLMKKNKVTVIDGHGQFIHNNTISVVKNNAEVTQVEAKYFIVATGARGRILPGYEPCDLIWTYKEAMIAKELPKSLIVVGTGVIGMEYASFYSSLGVKVTCIDMCDTILRTEDAEIIKIAYKHFEKQGIEFHLNAKLLSCEKGKKDVTVNFEQNGKVMSLSADKLLMSVGVIPNTEGNGFNVAGIKLGKNGGIMADAYCATDNKNIYAIGDVLSQGPWLAHKASHDGIVAAESIAAKLGKYDAKKVHPVNIHNVPRCIYSHPQIAAVGLTESECIAAGKQIRVGRFSAIGNGKAIAMNETDGIIKVIFNSHTGEILGAHLIGAEVTEMIQGFVIAKQNELTEEELMSTIFPHPTMSEMMHEAVLDAYGRVVHL
jgi:dihydrolipoamide dehydrogenase